MRNIRIIARFEVARLARSTGGVLFLALATIIYAYVALKLVRWAAEVREATALADADNPANKILTGFVGWLVDIEPEALTKMIGEHAPFALVLFFVGLAVNPLLAILGTADQTGSDIQTRHIRYLLLRTDRASLYWGKTLGALLFYGVSMAIICGLIGGAALWGGAIGAGDLPYFLRVWLTLTLFAVPFIALNGLTSAMTGHPGLALVVTLAFYMVVWLISAIGAWAAPQVAFIEYLSPSALKFDLASDDLTVLGKAIGHMAAVTVVAGLIGSTLFKRRDV
ncbi:MAG: hypothetical protein R3F43_07605 [bacterium]